MSRWKFYQNITKYTQRCSLNFQVKEEVSPKHYKAHTEMFFRFYVKEEVLPKHYKVHTEMFFRFSCQGESFTKTLQSTHTQMFLSYITKYTQRCSLDFHVKEEISAKHYKAHAHTQKFLSFIKLIINYTQDYKKEVSHGDVLHIPMTKRKFH